MEYFQRHAAPMPDVFREKDRGHAALTELALDSVPIGQGHFQAFWWRGHGAKDGRCRSRPRGIPGSKGPDYRLVAVPPDVATHRSILVLSNASGTVPYSRT